MIHKDCTSRTLVCIYISFGICRSFLGVATSTPAGLAVPTLIARAGPHQPLLLPSSLFAPLVGIPPAAAV